jgi:hypothetical protein
VTAGRTFFSTRFASRSTISVLRATSLLALLTVFGGASGGKPYQRERSEQGKSFHSSVIPRFRSHPPFFSHPPAPSLLGGKRGRTSQVGDLGCRIALGNVVAFLSQPPLFPSEERGGRGVREERGESGRGILCSMRVVVIGAGVEE